MPPTKGEISQWFDHGEGAHYMIIKCDRSNDSGCCYPVYVFDPDDPRAIAKKDETRTMEVYNLYMEKHAQLTEYRAFHWKDEVEERV